MLLFMVAKAANGNCIYSVMYFAYLSNIGSSVFKEGGHRAIPPF